MWHNDCINCATDEAVELDIVSFCGTIVWRRVRSATPRARRVTTVIDSAQPQAWDTEVILACFLLVCWRLLWLLVDWERLGENTPLLLD